MTLTGFTFGPPAAAAAASQNQVAVPSLVGKPEKEAREMAEAIGLRVTIQEVVSSPEGTVYSQRPAPPTRVAPGSPMVLEVARKPPAAPVDPGIARLAEALERVEKKVTDIQADIASIKSRLPGARKQTTARRPKRKRTTAAKGTAAKGTSP